MTGIPGATTLGRSFTDVAQFSSSEGRGRFLTVAVPLYAQAQSIALACFDSSNLIAQSQLAGAGVKVRNAYAAIAAGGMSQPVK